MRSLLRNSLGYLRPQWAKLYSFIYLPFLGAGIRITQVAPDFLHMRIEMPLNFLNKNYVGVQFGGSIYAMCDPFYMFMLMQKLGPQYVVWDQAAKIDFLQPGRRRLVVDFHLTESEIDGIRARTEGGEKYVFDKEVLIRDTDGALIARVIKTLYVRRRKPS